MAAWRLWPVDITSCCTSSLVMLCLACKPAIYFLLAFWGPFCLWLWLQYVISWLAWLRNAVKHLASGGKKQHKIPHCVLGRLLGSEKLRCARIHPAAAVDSLIINKNKSFIDEVVLQISPFYFIFYFFPFQTFIIVSLWFRWIFFSSVYKCQTSTGFLCTLYPGEPSCFQPVFLGDWKYYLVIHHGDIVQFFSLLVVGQLSGAFSFHNADDEHTSGFNFVSYEGGEKRRRLCSEEEKNSKRCA